MSIKSFGNGGTSITGGSIRTFGLLQLAAKVGLEAKGLKCRGRSATAQAKEVTGLRTRDRTKLIAKLKEMASHNEQRVTATEMAEYPWPCTLCKAVAVMPMPEYLLPQEDGTTHVCHPDHGGCDHGFAIQGEA